MVGNLGSTELAAVSLGNSFIFIGMSLGIGFSTAITPLIAEADAEKDDKKIRTTFHHGFVVVYAFRNCNFYVDCFGKTHNAIDEPT